jgi:hypothetical protein
MITLLGFYQAQDVEKKKAEPKTPHFLSLNQYIVAWSQEEKCGLKYVSHSPGRHEKSGASDSAVFFEKWIVTLSHIYCLQFMGERFPRS